MDDKIVVFKRERPGYDWSSREESATLCSSGLDEYVSIPNRVNEFDAVFTTEEPRANGHFKMIKNPGDACTFQTYDGIAWTGDARDLLARLWVQGYRYCNVRYARS